MGKITAEEILAAADRIESMTDEEFDDLHGNTPLSEEEISWFASLERRLLAQQCLTNPCFGA